MSHSRFSLVPAAYVLLRRGNAVLLQRRAGTGFMDDHWASAAAGHVEAGESCLQAAVREAREEIGVDLVIEHTTPLCAMHRHQDTDRPVDQRVDFFFSCDGWEGEPHLVEEHKASALAWFDLAALPDPVVPHELAVLRALASGAVPPVLTFGF